MIRKQAAKRTRIRVRRKQAAGHRTTPLKIQIPKKKKPLKGRLKKTRLAARKRRRPLRKKFRFHLTGQPAAVVGSPLPPQAFTYAAAVGYTGRPDLLQQALQSVQPLWNNTLVIDNSKELSIASNPALAAVPVYQPPVPFTYSQTMNLLHRIGADRGCEVIIFARNDALAHPGTTEKLLDMIGTLQITGQKWGAVFTASRALAAYNMAAVREVGPWDIHFPHEFSDDDYHRRLQLAGYELVSTDLAAALLHEGQLEKSNPEPRINPDLMRTLYEQYYVQKWGGRPGEEQFKQLFNQFPLNPVPNYLS
ncbi:glycosyltransferase family 2 protein [Paenibacillus sp. y28]|uniref:glycosyltransferase family 2 protein n=1 Tax=Paenibacillus sp. y28 TaxID=3129110 RepID=UPI00301B3C7F